MPIQVNRKRFAEIVEKALAELPEPFASHMDEMTVEIIDHPTDRQLKNAGLDDDELLMGLYEGVSMLDRNVEAPPTIPDKIFIFQEDHELVCDSEEQLEHEVRTTVLHEIGHHFGMDEEDLERLGYR